MTKPILHQKDAFLAVLNDYHISEGGKQLLKDLHLVLLVAPTSVGKNTLIDQLLQTGRYEAIVSDTTRPPRMENGKLEEHGVRYFFREEQDVLTDLQNGEFLEASLIHEQQVSGISLRELKKAAKHNKIAINEVEVVGAHKIVGVKPDAHAIFLLPPSFKEWMHRLNKRGTMSEHELENRMKSTKTELMAALSSDYYHYVVNDNIEDAVHEIRDIVENNHHSVMLQQDGLAVANALLEEVIRHLAA